MSVKIKADIILAVHIWMDFIYLITGYTINAIHNCDTDHQIKTNRQQGKNELTAMIKRNDTMIA